MGNKMLLDLMDRIANLYFSLGRTFHHLLLAMIGQPLDVTTVILACVLGVSWSPDQPELHSSSFVIIRHPETLSRVRAGPAVVMSIASMAMTTE
jgi:hypothetical protein